MIVQDLWQAHYQILSMIFLKEFIELNVNTDTVIKNVRHVEVNISIATVSCVYKFFKDDLIEFKCLVWNKNCKKKFDKKLKKKDF